MKQYYICQYFNGTLHTPINPLVLPHHIIPATEFLLLRKMGTSSSTENKHHNERRRSHHLSTVRGHQPRPPRRRRGFIPNLLRIVCIQLCRKWGSYRGCASFTYRVTLFTYFRYLFNIHKNYDTYFILYIKMGEIKLSSR